MPRIPAVAPGDGGPLIKVAYKFAARQFDEVPEPFAVLANHKKLFLAAAGHEMAVQKASKVLPVSVRELAVYRVASTVGCSWCVDFGTMLARLDGLDVERLKAIEHYRDSPLYSEDERAAIAYADAMTGDPHGEHGVTDEHVADLESRFGRAGVVELTYQIGLENMRSRMYSALGITEQGFGTDSCRVPWSQE
ncbi:carboxymuconolactone decarboxylase family protein [Rhodococcus sp. IEGM 1366]|uniref:carboxymuconolactone decarboxylase family protein n=1 Tax=Rhodococcus sp. IEGM 1366 TaxID=3082223 RepID=UPI0029539978|nr:carboxymuconolactone decarboxylase family protein [Rhodococcus sp. IEGM 1366]MDV8068527.1 carboxymuconolactone decarboxylase family protein [Rhodococcus sp. IEGM 1366]